MTAGRESDREPDPNDRVPDQRESKDTDRLTKRTEEPQTDPGETAIDPDAPGNLVDDTNSDSVPEPNEPA